MAPVYLSSQKYGKSKVQLVKVIRKPNKHHIIQYTVHVHIDGAFDRAYTHGDNRNVIPTDTCKNTVYALAKQNSFSAPEEFAAIIIKHFFHRYRHVEHVAVDIDVHNWTRIPVAGTPHRHSFVEGTPEIRTVHAERARNARAIQFTSGVRNLKVLKTTESGFERFHQCEWTTLKDATDRIFATVVTATWTYSTEYLPYCRAYKAVKRAITEVFATHDSPSVQATLFKIGQRALADVDQVSAITLSMPNVHNNLADIAKLGLQNNNEVFVPTTEPSGSINATVSRRKGSRM